MTRYADIGTGFEIDKTQPFGIWTDPRTVTILFEDGLCRVCGYLIEKHRIVFPEELTTEWRICGTERIGEVFIKCLACGEEITAGHEVCPACGHVRKDMPDSEVTQTRYYCIPKKEQEEYMTRDEFEELYNDE